MDPGHIVQLVIPEGVSVENRRHAQGQEGEPEFLSLKLLNKRNRVRLSPVEINCTRLPGRSSLLAVGNKKGCFAAAVHKADNTNGISLSYLSDLRTAFESDSGESEPFIPLTARCSFNTPGTPTIIKFALNDERLVVGLVEGPILVYETNGLFKSTYDTQPTPVYSISGDVSTMPREILPNPGETPELVAVMRGVHGKEHEVDIIDVQRFQIVAGWHGRNDSGIMPVSISWSPKGKQIAIGLYSGDVLLYSPFDVGNPKSHLKPPSTPPGASSILATAWLSSSVFYTIFSSSEVSLGSFDLSAEYPAQTHFVSIRDSSSDSVADVELRDPCPPFGARRPPGPLLVVLRNWSPSRFIIFCGDGPSPDIGVIGTLSDPSGSSGDVWSNFNLEETSTPSLPLDENMNDPALLGLEIDLTSSKPVCTSDQAGEGTPDLPPSPILYAYTSEGTIVAWHVLNSNGSPYPGMMAAVESLDSSMQQSQESRQASMKSSPTVSPIASSTPTPTPPFPPLQTSSSPAPSIPPFASVPQSAIDADDSVRNPGAFSDAKLNSKFGSTGFGFGINTLRSPNQSPNLSAFGSSGFGQSNLSQTEKPKLAASTTSGATEFGQTSPASGTAGFGSKPVAPAFGASGFGSKPATPAFGSKPAAPAFGTSSFGPSPATPAFGTSSFGPNPATPAFGTSSFGSKPVAPAFGQTGFGIPSSGAAKQASSFGPSSGGFASFASQGSSAFVAPANSPSASESRTQATSIFGQGAFGQANLPSPHSAFGAGGQGQASPAPSLVFGDGGTSQTYKPVSSPTATFGRSSAPSETAFGSSSQITTKPSFGKTDLGSAAGPSLPSSGAFSGLDTLGETLKSTSSPARLDSPPGSPTNGTPPSSPEMLPKSHLAKPTSSYVKPAEGFGSLIKPAEGFGAFGASKSSYPFLKSGQGFGTVSQKPTAFAPTQPQSSVPAFGSAGFGSSGVSSGGSATPTFGSTSALGQKPAFGASSFGTTSRITTEPPKPVSGGFSAFSSGNGGFASFANANKTISFGDILASGDPDKSERNAANTPALKNTSAINEAAIPTFNLSTETKTSLIQPANRSVDAHRSEHIGTEPPKWDEMDEKSFKDRASAGSPYFGNKQDDRSPSSHPSKGSMSPMELPLLSSTSHTIEEREVVAGEPDDIEKSDEDPDGEGTPSEPFSLTDEAGGSESDDSGRSPQSAGQLLSEAEVQEPAQVPLPETPQDQTPPSTPTPTLTPVASEAAIFPLPVESSTQCSNKAEASTTPPGSPTKAIVAQPTLSAPIPTKPVPQTSTPSPFGLGLGRPSSRPVRSSPLASVPVTSAEEIDSPAVATSKSALITLEPNHPQPQSLFAPPTSIDSQNGPATPRSGRPKTPPLLGLSVPSQSVKPESSNSPLFPARSPATSAPLTTPPIISAFSQPVHKDGQQEIKEHPMQVEFLRVYQEMTNELARLYTKVRETAMFWPAIKEPRGLEKLLLNNQGFQPGKYSLGDLQSFTMMIGILQKSVIPILEHGHRNKLLLRDLQNLALISETKQEEISRWVRARQDPGFTKTVKPHALGPEHSENQVRLRKAVQAARDRIQQCEDEMEFLKKRLEQHKSGKLGFRPPSLDMIDRTCRNIQIALEERIKLSQKLHDRIEALSLKTSKILRSSKGQPASSTSNLHDVTPPFASVAAAALNFERYSLKLKNALLTARKEPLFTNKISKLESAKADTQRIPASLHAPQREWKLPPIPPLDSPKPSFSSPSSVARRGRTAGKKHGAVPFDPSTPNQSTKSVAFDWGPLPGVAPMQKLSDDVRSQKDKSMPNSE